MAFATNLENDADGAPALKRPINPAYSDVRSAYVNSEIRLFKSQHAKSLGRRFGRGMYVKLKEELDL